MYNNTKIGINLELDKLPMKTNGKIKELYSFRTSSHLILNDRQDLPTSDIEVKKPLSGNLARRISLNEESIKNKVRLADAIEIAKIGVWEYDCFEEELVFEKKTCELLGIRNLTNGPIRISTEKFLDKYINGQDKENLTRDWEIVINGLKKRFQFKFKIINDRDEVVEVLTIAHNEYDNNMKLISCYGVIQDVSEKKSHQILIDNYQQNLEKFVDQQYSKLRQSESRLRDALKIANLSTWEFDYRKQIFNLSTDIYSVLDISYQDEGKKRKIIDRNDFTKLLGDEIWNKYQSAFDVLLNDNDASKAEYLNIQFRNKNGRIIHLNFSVKVQFDNESGGIVKFYGTVQNVTDIKATFAERERLIGITEATTDLVLIIDDSMNISYMNKSGRKFFGIEEQKDIKKVRQKGSGVSYNISKQGLKLASKEGVWEGETTVSGKDKDKIPVNQLIIAHKNSVSEVDYYSVIFRDLTRRKEIEDNLRLKNSELDTFIYRASHDLRGPISSLMGLYNVVKIDIKDDISLQYFDLYNNQVTRLNNIVLALIKLTNIRESPIQKQLISFDKIIKTCINSFNFLPNYKNIDFKIKLDQGLKYYCDETLINTIISNLLENSIKFSRIDIEAKIEIRIIENINSLQIEVNDNGVGIDKKLQSKIFNMFYRAHVSSTGSGLGLYLLKNAVEKLSGEIIVSSEVGKGSSFVIELPLK